MARRSRAREVVLQVLYQEDLNPASSPELAEQFLRLRLPGDEQLLRFARQLVLGVRAKKPELDQILAAKADNWSLTRMAATDRNILRLATYEILHAETPRAVAINEAVELAKRFGARQSAQFVNGILDRIVRPGEN